eukprot:TRINITY_DN2228_c0_g1_i11.p1 TRINITY_DN2228_c0_g1~~TRINITY_DN2228_c0_g1_i11.p1  ORF type:complete len:271 (-),score=47.90 TRINITY_DN2228_c0_g1_i11:1114-1926(-)
MDELASAICVSFNHDGSKIYCGFDKMIRVFDTNRPGRDHTNIPTTQHTGKRRQHIGQKGAISCLAFSPDNSKLFAAGSYSKTIGLYSEDQRNLVWMETASEGGVSQVQFSYDGTYLYSAGRKDSKILCWDIRNTGDIVYTMDRVAPTNQHIHFEIDSSGTQLVAASQDGIVRVYDLLRSGELIAEINTFESQLILLNTKNQSSHMIFCCSVILLSALSKILSHHLCLFKTYCSFPPLLWLNIVLIYSSRISEYRVASSPLWVCCLLVWLS